MKQEGLEICLQTEKVQSALTDERTQLIKLLQLYFYAEEIYLFLYSETHQNERSCFCGLQ